MVSDCIKNKFFQFKQIDNLLRIYQNKMDTM
jgi:hypothetical protein